MKLTFQSDFDQLDYELAVLVRASKDEKFTRYLYSVKGELSMYPEAALDLRKKTIQSYDIYVREMQNMGIYVEPFYYKSIYDGFGFGPVVKKTGEETPDEEDPEEKTEDKTLEKSLDLEKTEEPVKEEIKNVPEDVTSGMAAASQEVNSGSAGEEISVSPAPQSQPQPSFYDQPVFKQAAQYFDDNAAQPKPGIFDRPAYTQTSQSVKDSAPAAASKKAEFAVGAVVMSIIGSIFLLTGIVYFAVNYLDNFIQGMLLYAACAGVLCVSELIIRRFVPKLSSVFTAIGISGTFLATIVNYRSLDNLNLPATAIILAVCAVLVCLFGYIRKSQLYSIIGFLAAFISSFAMGYDLSGTEFIVVSFGTLLISALWLIFPVEEYHEAVCPVMIFAELIYMLSSSRFTIVTETGVAENFLKIVFLICSMIVINFVYFVSIRFSLKIKSTNEVYPVFNIVLYSSAVLCSAFATLSYLSKMDLSSLEQVIFGVIIYLLFVIPAGIFAYLMKNFESGQWIVFYVSAHAFGLVLLFGTGNLLIMAILLCAHMIISRFMTRFDEDKKIFSVIDIIIQSVTGICFVVLTFDAVPAGYIEIYISFLIVTASAAAAIFIGKGFINEVQMISVFVICIVMGSVFVPESLAEAVCMGLVLLFTYLINNIQKIKGDHYVAFNWFALVMDTILILFGANNDYSVQDVIIYSIEVIFGLALIILLMNREYGMPFRGKYIVAPAYLTFVSFLAPIPNGFILSIILMAIAVVSVVLGFILREKTIRVYGLILSILICGKIALMDFVSIGDIRSKTIMYILVGAFALAIGCIYLILESRENKSVKAQSQSFDHVQNVSVEWNTENKELYEENKTV